MRLRSLFASRSSISVSKNLPALLVAGTVLGAVVGALGWALDRSTLAAVGLIAATALAGAFAVYLIVSERRRHESAEDELTAQASFLESLVESIAAVSSTLDPDEIVERACEEAKRLFDARSARFVPPGEQSDESDGKLVVPLAVRGEPIGSLEITRSEPFARWDRTRATVLADFASRAVENARLLVEAHERESERGRLTEQLITAEQDERRRLSLYLHDGPVQAMAGIALMHDAALAAIEDGRYEDAAKVIESSLERERRTISELRDLSFAIEPVVLRDQGFEAAVRALADQVEQSQGITVAASVGAGERLSEKAQVALYQVIREAINQAVRRRPGQIGVTVEELGDGGFATEVDDDGVDERRRASIEAIEERVRILNGRLSIEPREEGGTAIRVVMPAYVAAAQG
jgi:signal transduction histidine kinase